MTRVSFLVPDSAGPVMGPVISMARMLEETCAVEIVAPDFGHGVHPMYRDAYPFKLVPTPRMYRFTHYRRDRRRLADALEGEVVVAAKAMATSLSVGADARRRRGKKLVAYLDEWDGALWSRFTAAEKFHAAATTWQHPTSECYLPFVERQLGFADAILSTCRGLQDRFGGDVLYAGADTELFRPATPDETAALRRELGVEGKQLIVFGGVVRPHKGVETILSALSRLGDPNVVLLVVGPETDHLRRLMAQPAYASMIRCTGAKQRAAMPLHLALADVIALPLKDDPLARTQMPCKVFEAMAMGLPIVGSAVSDLPLALDGCGWIVPPGDPAALAAALRDVFEHPEIARKRGALARERCIQRFSKETARRTLIQVVGRVATL